MYQRIPTVEEVNQAYMNLQDAAAVLGVPTSNIPQNLARLGLQLVRLCGKPMVYRHQVEALLRRAEGDKNPQGALHAVQVPAALQS